MVSFKTTSTLALLFLAFLATLSDAKESAPLSDSSVEDVMVFEQEFRLLQNATDDEFDEDDHGDEDHEEEEGHDHEHEDEHHDEISAVEIGALEAKCTCMEGKLFCSDAEALEQCRCEEAEAHCGKLEEEHADDHDDHDDHDGYDQHDDHDDHGDHEDHDGHEGHDDHSGHDDHDDHHGHSHAHSDHSEFEAQEDDSKPWGIVIGMSIVVNLTTLAGVFVIGGHWGRNVFCKTWKPKATTGELWVHVIIPMFACGTLLATTFFLLLPEALRLIESEFGGHEGHDHRRLEGESATTWRWGASVLGGFLFPVFLNIFFPHGAIDGHTHAPMIAAAGDKEKDTEAEAPVDVEKSSQVKRMSIRHSLREEYVSLCGCLRLKNVPLFVSMNIGEALHNFTDGLFIGAAYVGCGTAFGHSVVLATVLHEFPNQLAGYLVMVNQNGIDPIIALLLNFLFGLSCLVGALVILVLDLGNVAIGCTFAIGGGIFLHVAISEMLCTAEEYVHGCLHVGYMVVSFIVGAVVIGLVLLDHEHCGGH